MKNIQQSNNESMTINESLHVFSHCCQSSNSNVRIVIKLENSCTIQGITSLTRFNLWIQSMFSRLKRTTQFIAKKSRDHFVVKINPKIEYLLHEQGL